MPSLFFSPVSYRQNLLVSCVVIIATSFVTQAQEIDDYNYYSGGGDFVFNGRAASNGYGGGNRVRSKWRDISKVVCLFVGP